MDTPLTPEAKELLDKISPRIQRDLEAVTKVPVSTLIWGPNPNGNGPVAEMRKRLKSELRQMGHLSMFSEDLYDPHCGHSIRIQQIAHAKEFDLVISLPDTPGSIGEIHDFANDRRVNSKIIIFLNSDYIGGYSAQSLKALESMTSCLIKEYEGYGQIDEIVPCVKEEVTKLRDVKFILEGRI